LIRVARDSLRKLTLLRNIRRLHKLNEAWNVPVTVENLPGAAGSVAVSKSSPDEFAAIIKADTAKWAKVIRDAGIKASE
jgi:tripartite-type tricarboxylate transporter receptor subunit TctC